MNEKITIKGFASISLAEIDFNKITVLIGPQATGKSIIAKLLYFFKKVPITLISDEIEVQKKGPATGLFLNYLKNIFRTSICKTIILRYLIILIMTGLRYQRLSPSLVLVE